MLAMFLHMRDYLKLDNEKEREEALAHWLAQNQKFMDRDDGGRSGSGGSGRYGTRQPTPAKVAKAFCDRFELPLEEIEDGMDWVFLADCAQESALYADDDAQVHSE